MTGFTCIVFRKTMQKKSSLSCLLSPSLYFSSSSCPPTSIIPFVPFHALLPAAPLPSPFLSPLPPLIPSLPLPGLTSPLTWTCCQQPLFFPPSPPLSLALLPPIALLPGPTASSLPSPFLLSTSLPHLLSPFPPLPLPSLPTF